MIRKFLCVLALSGLAAAVQAEDYTPEMAAAPEAAATEPVATETAEPEMAATEAAPAGSFTCPDGSTVSSEDGCVDDRFYMAPFGTYFNGGGDRNSEDGWGGGLGIGKMINEYFNIEARGFWTGYDGQDGGRADLTGGLIDFQYYFMRETFSPYAVIGLGGMNTSNRTNGVSSRSGASFIGQAGVGATYEVADNFLVRGDVRYQYNYEGNAGAYPNDDDFHDLVVNLGFVVPFGEKPKGVPVAAAPVDDCSTRDSDGDGVNDCDDKCPGTMKGGKVDEYGCLVKIELRGVQFHFDSAELTDGAKAILDEVADGLIASDEKKDIEVAGHASDEGYPNKRQYNLKLSQRRAASVVEYLKMRGVTNNLYPKGYGVEYPIASNATEEGREKNRRVELVWMGE